MVSGSGRAELREAHLPLLGLDLAELGEAHFRCWNGRGVKMAKASL